MSPELAASMQHAELLLKGRDPEGALRMVVSAPAARPALPRAHMIAAMAKLRQGRPGEAVGHLDVRRRHSRPGGRRAGRLYYYAGRALPFGRPTPSKKPRKWLRKGRSRFAESAELAVAEGLILFERLGRHGDAIAAYRAATTLAPDSAEAWSSLPSPCTRAARRRRRSTATAGRSAMADARAASTTI